MQSACSWRGVFEQSVSARATVCEVDPLVIRLIAAAQLVRESHEASDEIWSAAHEVLYEALAEVEAQVKSPPPSRSRQRGPHWPAPALPRKRQGPSSLD